MLTKYLYTTLLDSQYISSKSIWTVKYILSQVFIPCMPHVNANLLHIMLDSVACLYTTWPEFHWWSLSCVSVVWCKPNALLSAYSDSTSSLLQVWVSIIVIMHSQNDSSSSWLQYFTLFTINYDLFWLLIPLSIGIWILLGARYSAPIQNGPKFYTPSCTNGIVFLSWQ